MGRALGFIALLIALAVGVYVYTQSAKSASGGAANPQAAIDLVGVKTDILAIAHAEQTYQAQQGKYASLDELRAAGTFAGLRTSRGPYGYSVEVSDSGFRVVATYSGQSPNMPTVSVDQSMRVTE